MANIDLYMQKLVNIANAIRTKLGATSSDTYTLEQMPNKILSIPSGGELPDEYCINFPAYTGSPSRGGPSIYQMYSIHDDFIRSKKYNRLKLQAYFLYSSSTSDSKIFELIMSIIFYKEPVWDSTNNTVSIDTLYYKLNTDGTYTKTPITITCSSIAKSYVYDGKTVNIYYCNPGMSSTASSTLRDAMNYNRWTYTSTANTGWSSGIVYGNIKTIYEDAIASGYKLLSDVEGINSPTGFSHNGSYYRPLVIFNNGTKYATLGSSINCYLYVSRTQSTTQATDYYRITPVTMPGTSGYADAINTQIQDNNNGEYNIKLYNA